MRQGEMHTSRAPALREPPIGAWTSAIARERPLPGLARQAGIPRSLEPPWNAIVEVVARFTSAGRDGVEIAGSGWLCAPGLVLTSAHLVHLHFPDGHGQRASSVRVRIGTGAGAGPMSLRTPIAPEDILVPSAFAGAVRPRMRQDYAFLRVRNARLAAIAPAPIPLSTGDPRPGDPVIQAGLVRQPGQRSGVLSGGEGPLNGETTFELSYPVAGRPGQEGGPVLMRDPSDASAWLAIAIHLRATPQGGSARRIDGDISARLARLQETGGDG